MTFLTACFKIDATKLFVKLVKIDATWMKNGIRSLVSSLIDIQTTTSFSNHGTSFSNHGISFSNHGTTYSNHGNM